MWRMKNDCAAATCAQRNGRLCACAWLDYPTPVDAGRSGSAGRLLAFFARVHRGGFKLHRPVCAGCCGPGHADRGGRHDIVWPGCICGRGCLRHRLGVYLARRRVGSGGCGWACRIAVGRAGDRAGGQLCDCLDAGCHDCQAVWPLPATVYDCLGPEPVLPVWQHGVFGRANRHQRLAAVGAGRLVTGFASRIGCADLGCVAGRAVAAAQPA